MVAGLLGPGRAVELLDQRERTADRGGRPGSRAAAESDPALARLREAAFPDRP